MMSKKLMPKISLPTRKQNKNRDGRRRPKRSGRNGKGRAGRDVAAGVVTGSVQRSGFSVRSMPFFGYRVRKQLNYYSSGAIVSGASSANAYVFSANGMFDPDITGTGGQPMSFDQAMLFYNHYTVHRSTIRVTFMSDSTTLRASVGIFVSGSSTVTTSIEQLLENGDGAFQILEYAGAYGGTATFQRTLNVGRFQDVSDVMDDPNMRGDSASNPTEQAYYHLVVYNSGTAATVQVDFQAVITYDATFHEPRKGPLS